MGHGHHHHVDLEAGDRRVFAAIAVNMGLTVAQIVGGIVSGSLALIADALHNFSDAISLIIAFGARKIARRPRDAEMTFGYGRVEVVAALINYTTLIVIGLYLLYEAAMRFADPQPVEGWLIVIIAGIALIVDAVTAALTYAIERSCAAKARVVGADERESGIRATLNLGHTFGHAIETEQGYGVWLHGEAVAAGTVMALEMSYRLGWLSAADRDRGVRLLQAAGLPVVPPEDMTPEQFLEHMAVDKKVLDGQLRLVLLRHLGEAVVTADYPREILDATLRSDYAALAQSSNS